MLRALLKREPFPEDARYYRAPSGIDSLRRLPVG